MSGSTTQLKTKEEDLVMLKILHIRPQRATAREKISQDLARIIASDEAKAIGDQQF